MVRLTSTISRALPRATAASAMAQPTFPVPMMPSFMGVSVLAFGRQITTPSRWGPHRCRSVGADPVVSFHFFMLFRLCNQFCDLPDLVVVDCVTHARMNALGHICAKVPQHPSGLVHAPYRNVAIDVA